MVEPTAGAGETAWDQLRQSRDERPVAASEETGNADARRLLAASGSPS